MYLLFIGTLCLNGYKYLRLECPPPNDKSEGNEPHPGWTCIYAAGLYLMIIVLIILYRSYNRKRRDLYLENNSTSSDEDEPLVKFERKKFR
jgi:hypothetical protein